MLCSTFCLVAVIWLVCYRRVLDQLVHFQLPPEDIIHLIEEFMVLPAFKVNKLAVSV